MFTFKNYFTYFLFFIVNFLQGQNFEGQLNYSIEMDGYIVYKSDTLSIKDRLKKKGEYFDSLQLIINDLGYVKTINNGKKEKYILNFKEQKKYIISEKELIIDDLNFRNLYNRNSTSIELEFDKIIETKRTDTLINFNSKIIKAEKIVVKKKYAKEIYLVSDELPKLPVDRNVLVAEDSQVYENPVLDIINSRIIIEYEMEQNVIGYSKINIKLNNMLQRKVLDDELSIPKHVETKELKKINKDSERFKFYKILN
jgi:hypothetical protein